MIAPPGMLRVALRAAVWLALAAVPPGVVPAQPPAPPPSGLRLTPSDLLRPEWQLRLAEVDRLLALGNPSRAELLLGELAKGPAPRRELLPRWLALAQQKGDHAEAARLCREGLAGQPGNPRFLRELAQALMALDDTPAARAAVDSFLVVSPDPRSGALVAVDLWQRAGRPDEALALCDEMRLRSGDARLLARQRAASLIAVGREEEGADELVDELSGNAANLPLLRTDLLEMTGTPEAARRLAERFTVRAAAGGEAVAPALVLAASLWLRLGEAEAATRAVAPLLEDARRATVLLQLCSVLVREAPLTSDTAERTAVTGFLLDALERLSAPGALDAGLRPRALDLLAQAAEDALRAGTLAAGPEAAERRLERVLAVVREGSPGSAHLYAAQILLARHTWNALGRPAEAAARLERLLTDLDLPLEGVALARLTLGECQLAAGDTARGRAVLTALARDARHRNAAGHAHYHLARLDLAEGHFETARDRFAALALDNAMAGYANDALDLGLAVAEELDSPSGGPQRLARYARSVFFQVIARPDSQRVALERFVEATVADADPGGPPRLLERGRFELAGLYHREGRLREAIAQCDRIVLDQPDGRYAGEALAFKGEILLAAGDPAEARAAWERLLVQYPDYLFADDVRERMRSLP